MLNFALILLYFNLHSARFSVQLIVQTLGSDLMFSKGCLLLFDLNVDFCELAVLKDALFVLSELFVVFEVFKTELFLHNPSLK